MKKIILTRGMCASDEIFLGVYKGKKIALKHYKDVRPVVAFLCQKRIFCLIAVCQRPQNDLRTVFSISLLPLLENIMREAEVKR